MKYIFIVLAVIILQFIQLNLFAQGIVEIYGVVKDESTGNPIENCLIETNIEGVSKVLTDVNGKYRFYLRTNSDFILTATKNGYEPYSRHFNNDAVIQADLLLKPITRATVSIVMTDFQSGRYIKGRLLGTDTGEYSRLKLLVYVLTNKWYIHPYASNTEGKGYAKIKSDGTWLIETVWRLNQAFKVAFLIVDKNYTPPSIIDGDSGQDLLDKIQPIYQSIIEAPEGI